MIPDQNFKGTPLFDIEYLKTIRDTHGYYRPLIYTLCLKKRANFGKLYSFNFQQAWTKRHERTFKNYLHIQIALFFHFCLINLLLF